MSANTSEKELQEKTLEQFLSFIIDEEEYAVSILTVREIRGWEPVTPIPNVPKYVKGFINLRGTVVPIVDLRERFRLEIKPYTGTTVVIILTVDMSNPNSDLVGIIVDAVSEVYDIKQSDIRAAPRLGGHIEACYIKGIAEVNDKNIILTDVLSLLDAESLIQTAAQV